MQEDRNIIPIVMVCAVVAVVFLLVALLVPFDRTSTFWAAFVFGLMALAVALAANLYVAVGSRSLRSAFYRVSISTISIVYLMAAIIVSLIFMAASTLPIWPLILIQAILLALCALGLIGGNSVAGMVEGGEAATQQQTSVIRDLRMHVQALETTPQDPNARAALKKLSDELRYTDPVSTPECASYDQQLLMDMGRLNAAVETENGETTEQLSACMCATIAQRAAVCRASKG